MFENIDLTSPGAIEAVAFLINAARAASQDIYNVLHNLLVRVTTNEQLNAILAKAEELAEADAADARSRVK